VVAWLSDITLAQSYTVAEDEFGEQDIHMKDHGPRAGEDIRRAINEYAEISIEVVEKHCSFCGKK